MKSACWYVHVLGKKRQKWGENWTTCSWAEQKEPSSVCSRACALKGPT